MRPKPGSILPWLPLFLVGIPLSAWSADETRPTGTVAVAGSGAIAGAPGGQGTRISGAEATTPAAVAPAGVENPADAVIDGFILIVDCNRTMAWPNLKSDTQWIVSHVLDAAPDGIPLSVILFGHHPAVPKNLVELLQNIALEPLKWRTKSAVRFAVTFATPSMNRVPLASAVTLATEIAASSGRQRVDVLVVTDGQSSNDALHGAIMACVGTNEIHELRAIGLGPAGSKTVEALRSQFEGSPKLGFGYGRNHAEVTDSLLPVVDALDHFRRERREYDRKLLAHSQHLLAHSNQRLEGASSSLGDLTTALEQEKVKNEGLGKSVSKLTTKVDELNDKAKSQAKHYEERIAKLTSEGKFQDEQIHKLAEERKGLKDGTSALEVSVKQLETALATRTNEANELQRNLDNSRGEYAGACKTAAALKEELSRACDNLKRTQAELDVCRTEKCDLEKHATAEGMRICSLEQLLGIAREREVGAIREMAAAKRDCPGTIFNDHMVAGGTPVGVGGGTPGGVASGGTPGGVAGAGPPGGVAGGGSAGGGGAAGGGAVGGAAAGGAAAGGVSAAGGGGGSGGSGGLGFLGL